MRIELLTHQPQGERLAHRATGAGYQTDTELLPGGRNHLPYPKTDFKDMVQEQGTKIGRILPDFVSFIPSTMGKQ